MHKDGTIFVETWFVRDYAEFRVTLDESDCMGDNVRLSVMQRIFDIEPTITTLYVDRQVWERLMHTRTLYAKEEDVTNRRD